MPSDAEAEKEKSDAAKRKNKPKKVEVKKYYAVAVGRKTGVFTTWDEADRSVNS
jgi:viroplasmin and RNaseH domain-containing protein